MMAGPVSMKPEKDKSAGKAKEKVPELARRAPSYDPYADIMDLQSMAGNRAVSRLLQPDMNNAPPIVQDVLNSGNVQPLDLTVREFMESRFHHDFSQVRVHTDAKAGESARAVDALAYTVGQDIVFGAGQYHPKTEDGQKLLAHELTHVIQQENPSADQANSMVYRQVEGPKTIDIESSGLSIDPDNKFPKSFLFLSSEQKGTVSNVSWGETSSIRPTGKNLNQPDKWDPDKTYELLQARAAIHEVAKRGESVRRSQPDEKKEFDRRTMPYHCVENFPETDPEIADSRVKWFYLSNKKDEPKHHPSPQAERVKTYGPFYQTYNGKPPDPQIGPVWIHFYRLKPAVTTAPKTLQPRLTVSQPGDAYEQEAERVAEQVMRMNPLGLNAASLKPNRSEGFTLQRADAETQAAHGAGNQAIQPANRPPRPSDPATQMRKLLEIARTTPGTRNLCYAAMKRNIRLAGGYGDLLDIKNDERFKGFMHHALQFTEAVEANGAEQLGLQEIIGNPYYAEPGTILVLRGRQGVLNINENFGDISVTGEYAEQGRNRVCYNFGPMTLPGLGEDWQPGGRYADFVVAMYRPLPRPAVPEDQPVVIKATAEKESEAPPDMIMRQAIAAPVSGAVPPTVHEVLRSSGHPLHRVRNQENHDTGPVLQRENLPGASKNSDPVSDFRFLLYGIRRARIVREFAQELRKIGTKYDREVIDVTKGKKTWKEARKDWDNNRLADCTKFLQWALEKSGEGHLIGRQNTSISLILGIIAGLQKAKQATFKSVPMPGDLMLWTGHVAIVLSVWQTPSTTYFSFAHMGTSGAQIAGEGTQEMKLDLNQPKKPGYDWINWGHPGASGFLGFWTPPLPSAEVESEVGSNKDADSPAEELTN